MKGVVLFSVLDGCSLALPTCRSLATTAAKKRNITQQIITLSLAHQFVTPLTALLVESDAERLLADSPRDPKQGCCSAGAWKIKQRLFTQNSPSETKQK